MVIINLLRRDRFCHDNIKEYASKSVEFLLLITPLFNDN